MSDSIFSRRSTMTLFVLGGVSLLAGFAGVIFWGSDARPSGGHNDSYSISALGHRAFVDLLESTGYNVLRSRFNTGSKVRRRGVLVLLEPDATAGEIKNLVGASSASLVVLPKWAGEDHPEHPGWIERVELVHTGDVEETLEGIDVEGTISRTAAARFARSDLPGTPIVARPLQVVATLDLAPILSSDAGVLLGETDKDGIHLVLSDPDILANHGIRDNAALVLAIMARIAEPGDTIIVDETLHGHEIPRNVWAELGRFPLVLVLASFAALIGVWIWSGMRRFGSPLNEDGRPGEGTDALIENTAQLLLFGGHSAAVLQRYLDHVVADVAHFYRLSPELSAEERLTRLEALSRASIPLSSLADQVGRTRRHDEYDEHHVLVIARRIRQWKQETLHGTR